MWMSAGDDQISLDDSSSFPDQVAVNRFSMSALIFPESAAPSLLLPGAAALFFFNARILARRAEGLRSAPVVISEHEERSKRAGGWGRPPNLAAC